MDNIITSQEVVDIAFPANSNMKAGSINEYVIHATEIKYIRAALGETLYAKLGELLICSDWRDERGSVSL